MGATREGTRRRPNETTFEHLYRAHAREVYGVALAELRDRRDAEDATQTAFLNAYRAIRRGERPESPRAWLYAIVRNVCRRPGARAEHAVELNEAISARADHSGPTADEIISALGQLTDAQRRAFVLHDVQGLSPTETASRLGVSRGAADALLHRARATLREQLEAADAPLTCGDADAATARQLEGVASWSDRRALRAHLRSCRACATAARRRRARAVGSRAFSLAPLLHGVTSFVGRSAPATSMATVVGAAAVGTSVVALPAGDVPVRAGAAISQRVPAATAPVVARERAFIENREASTRRARTARTDTLREATERARARAQSRRRPARPVGRTEADASTGASAAESAPSSSQSAPNGAAPTPAAERPAVPAPRVSAPVKPPVKPPVPLPDAPEPPSPPPVSPPPVTPPQVTVPPLPVPTPPLPDPVSAVPTLP